MLKSFRKGWRERFRGSILLSGKCKELRINSESSDEAKGVIKLDWSSERGKKRRVVNGGGV